jgi:aminoglycoside phosphotransferase (APT) family kinase protein
MANSLIPTDQEQLIKCLAAVHEAMSVDLGTTLLTPRYQENITCIIRILSRLIVELGALPRLASENRPEWDALYNRLAKLTNMSMATMESHSDPYAALKQIADRLGSFLISGKGSAFRDSISRCENPASEWFDNAVDAATVLVRSAENTILQKPPIEASTSLMLAPEAVRGKLNAYLKSRFPSMPEPVILSLEWVPGGRSKFTALLEIAEAVCFGRRLVLRMDAPGANLTGKRAASEYPLLSLLHRNGVAVARPVLAEADPAIIGGSFLISEEVVDACKGGEPFAELIDFEALSPDFAAELAMNLGRQHCIVEWPGRETGSAERQSTLLQIEAFAKTWADIPIKPPLHVATDLGLAWLLSHPLPKIRPSTLVHGDLGMHNILIRDGHLAAILDWELARLGDPAEDIGNCRAALLNNLIEWDKFVDIYTSAGGDPAACDLDAVIFQSIWAHTRGSIYTAHMWNLAMSGQRSELDYLSIGWDFFARTQDYILRELHVARARERSRNGTSRS